MNCCADAEVCRKNMMMNMLFTCTYVAEGKRVEWRCPAQSPLETVRPPSLNALFLLGLIHIGRRSRSRSRAQRYFKDKMYLAKIKAFASDT